MLELFGLKTGHRRMGNVDAAAPSIHITKTFGNAAIPKRPQRFMLQNSPSITIFAGVGRRIAMIVIGSVEKRLASFRPDVALCSSRPESPGPKFGSLHMTSTQKRLVQDTFATIAPIADDAAVLFYRRLFELDPSLQRMFRGDMTEQRKRLMQMIAVAVKGLDRLDQLVPAVQDLGRRHAGYGVEDRHYETVGAALIWTLEKGLGDAFTPEVREAWTKVYGILATTMKEAARNALVAV